MMFTRFVLVGGSIVSRKQIHTEGLDPVLLRQAEEALAVLWYGASVVSNPIPDGPEMTVRLASRSPLLTILKHPTIREWWIEYTGVDIEELQTGFKRMGNHFRRTGFAITHGDITAPYRLVSMDCQEEDAGIYGAVGGFYFSANSERISEQGVEEFVASNAFALVIAQSLEVVRDIVALKPAFIAPASIVGKCSEFGDHFAIAMLLAEARGWVVKRRSKHRRNTALRSKGGGRRA